MTETVSGASTRKGKAAQAQAGPSKLTTGRIHTTPGVHPYDQVTWERRDVVMTNWRDGSVNFEQRGVEFPDFWSVNAANIVTTKYFRGAVGSPQREWSLKQLVDRVVDTYERAGRKHGYFATDEDAEIFGHELRYALVHQIFSFNSPVWFNVGTASPQQVSACQPFDALVSTPAGLVPIGKLVEEDAVGTKVYDARGVTQIVATKANGAKQVLRLHTKAGYTLDVTSDHLVWRSSDRDTGRFVPAGSLRPGDMLQWHQHDRDGLVVENPDLWWPYTMGTPNLYNLRLEFLEKDQLSDATQIRFGIRSITQHRDQDAEFPDLGKGGNFYLQVNGRDFLVRGAVYTPDLLYRYDPDREAAVLRYVKDLGLNMLRWESKISSEHIVELADEQGIPLMFGWMCCNQWEKWGQWDEEDHRVAAESLRSQILMLRPHASVWIWANGSDGLPPKSMLTVYHGVLSELHWQNATVDTVSSFAKDDRGERLWDGIHMAGPYSWRPPTYWFSGRYEPSRGSCAEQGDNEHIPPYESLKKFIPSDKLWPINDTWYFHAGAIQGNNSLSNVQRAVDRRYGPSNNAEEFARKAQLAHYEATRAQFEAFAANGWANHKMTIYWMLNSHWPSFFGNIFDYYLRPGGAYYGAKKGLRPLSVVFDSYATGDHNQAKVTVVNQTPTEHQGLHVRVRVYNLQGKVLDDREAAKIHVASGGEVQAMTLPRYPHDSPVFFVRCQLFNKSGEVLAENIYWQSQKDDDLGDRKNDGAFALQQESWADMTALNSMPQAPLDLSAKQTSAGGANRITIRLHNATEYVAFFERAEITSEQDGDEILPIEYDDNYVTVFPGETAEIHGVVSQSDKTPAWVRVEGYNTPRIAVAIK